MSKDLDSIIGMMKRKFGRDITVYDESFLAKSLEKRLAAVSVESAGAYLDLLSGSKEEAEELFLSLHITYSEFFRNPLMFTLLEQLILPGLARGNGSADHSEIRIWSAGCAAGQEPYSLAILMDEMITMQRSAVKFRIFATDISEAQLAVARKGVYDLAAVQNVSLKRIRGCFTRHGERYTLGSRFKDMVDFSAYDLLEERSVCPAVSIFGDFDLVMCSNMLFYYRDDIRRFILEKFYRCLSPGGYMVTGETEKGIVEHEGGFRPVAPPVALFRKIT